MQCLCCGMAVGLHRETHGNTQVKVLLINYYLNFIPLLVSGGVMLGKWEAFISLASCGRPTKRLSRASVIVFQVRFGCWCRNITII